MKRNLAASKTLAVSAWLLLIVATLGTAAVWIGSIDLITPADLAARIWMNESRYTSSILAWDISSLMRGFSVFVTLTAVGSALLRLSSRLKYDSWAELESAERKVYQASIKDCGEVTEIEISRGGFFSTEYVIVKTDTGIFRCIGDVKAIQKGSPVQRWESWLIITDDGQEKHLKIA